MKKIIMFFLIYAFSIMFVYASNDNVKNRQNAMQQVREAIKVLFPMAKGKTDYDDFVVISMLD